MKLTLIVANIAAVTPLMLKKGSGDAATQVPAKALTIKAEVAPELLNELRDGLADKFFEPPTKDAPRVPCIPEIEGAIAWKTEYESGTLALDLSQLEDLDFEDKHLTLHGVSAKDIAFEPLPSGMVAFKVNAVFETDDAELRGKLDGLLRHVVRATFSKLTQKPLIKPEGPQDDAASRQQELIET
jgi:hypothetical protein